MPDQEEHLQSLIMQSVSVDFSTNMGDNMVIMHKREDTTADPGFQPENAYSDWFEDMHIAPNITGAIVDIGANNGDTTVYLARKFPHARIYALEPIPDNCFYTTWNLAANGVSLKRVSVLHGAITGPNTPRERLMTSPEYTSENWNMQPSTIQTSSDVSYH